MSLGLDLLLELTRRYEEPHRHYHALPHIADMLHRGRDLQLDDVQIAAIWFHDAIYDPRALDNEAQSAALAVGRLTAARWPAERIRLVDRIVLDTQQHIPSVPQAGAVIDLDLASLSVPWDEFLANTAAIRDEYAHVPEDKFRAGRRGWAERMLQRPHFYWTPYGQRLEAAARDNLARIVRELS